jgi:hypothetical protein
MPVVGYGYKSDPGFRLEEGPDLIIIHNRGIRTALGAGPGCGRLMKKFVEESV